LVASQRVRFARRFFVADAALAVIELLIVGYPLQDSYTLENPQRRLLLHAGLVALGLAQLVWLLALRSWLAPFFVAARRRAQGEVLEPATREAAHRALLRLPSRALVLRVALFATCGLVLPLLLHLRAGFDADAVAACAAIAVAHGFGVSVFRALWYARIVDLGRAAVLPDLDDLQRFAGAYKQRLLLATTAVGVLGVTAIALFGWYFVPLNLEHFLRLETWQPLTLMALGLLWLLFVRRSFSPIDDYLAAALSPRPADHPTRDDPRALRAFKAAQTLPYRLAVSKLIARMLGFVLLVVESVLFFSIDPENAALICGEGAMLSIGLALAEALWHRATLRPFLMHIAARHRPAPETVRTPLSLRSKMLAGFGVLTLCACGLSLFWSFTQYKTLATVFIEREAELRLEGVLGDLRAAKLADERALVVSLAARSDVKNDGLVFYYLPPTSGATPIAIGAKAPPLPWTGEALLRRLDRGRLELSGLRLTGAYSRIIVGGRDVGSLALLLPGYRGRGPSTVPQIRVLMSFFAVLLLASIVIVILVATDLAGPIRELERRAGAMAKGDLTRPVVAAAGEGDEVGRLSFAFEEMRRALNDKLRSSTEINLSLEAEVTRRTAELERRNSELNEALEQLQRAQDELVRAEKMASMGRLVAGIAHEINNPVNAVVNTVGPLEQTLEELAQPNSAAATDVKEMIRVIQRGARRTKEIVQALHNYSRGDDDRLLDLDLHKSIDETLDLLRHQLKAGIAVERNYGSVGRVRGRSALNQVFMNLLTNAAQALSSPSVMQPTIRIQTSRSQTDGIDRVEIIVADNGPGIPADVLPRIFDPFFTTKDVGEGSGLGLSIVHGIVERHGGNISVSSEVGVGTRFVVTLPQPSSVESAPS
jgi:signal transduction histidine kinase